MIESAVDELPSKGKKRSKLLTYYEGLDEVIDNRHQSLMDMAKIDVPGEQCCVASENDVLVVTDCGEAMDHSSSSATFDQVDLEAMRSHHRRLNTVAIQISFWSNVLLLALKIYAAVVSGSLSIVANALDSVLDILSGLVLWASNRAANIKTYRKQYKYPFGRKKAEAVGIVIFCAIMGAFALELVIAAVEDLTSKDGNHIKFEFWPLLITAFTVGLKFGLWIYCKVIHRITGSGSVDAYAQDHFNDFITNSFSFVVYFIAGKIHSAWRIDPIGSIFFAAFIVINWSMNAMDQIKVIVGRRAPDTVINMLAYIAANFDPRITEVDYVEAVHYGSNFMAEVHVVMDKQTKLADSHDVGEGLTMAIEKLDYIDRVFVHIDTESSHSVTYEHKTMFEV